MTQYRFDPDQLDRTASLLYAHVPEFYKALDHAAEHASPPKEQELKTLVRILAAPLATARQSIEELFGDFFVETAGDDVLELLAENIALNLIFRDSDANRRDLRNAMARRRRKGTPAMLQEMARTLSDRLVTTQEGWKHVQITQDLNILRLTRTTPNLRAPSNSHRADGPLASMARSVDPRPITARTGKIHPRHMAHWIFPSRFYPLMSADPFRQPDGADDLRYAFDGANAWRYLPVRSTGQGDSPGIDRVQEGFFAEDPGNWFGRDGRFTVRIAGLPAAATAQDTSRNPSLIPANETLLRPASTIDLIDHDGERTSGPVDIDLMSVPLVGSLPNIAAAVRRRRITIDANGEAGTAGTTGPFATGTIVMLRLEPAGGAASRVLSETVLLFTGGNARAVRANPDAELAKEGYKAGSVYVRIPEMRLTGPRWFYLAGDGSLHDAGLPGSGVIDLPLDSGDLPARALVSEPVGPVWPSAMSSQENRPFAPPLAAPGAPPVIMHGLTAVRPNGLNVPGTVRNAIVFAITYFDLGIQQFSPMLRLTWTGPDSQTAIWQVVSEIGTITQSAQPIPITDRFSELAQRIENGANGMALAYRFETSDAGTILNAGEIAFTAVDGSSVLIHLPELVANAPNIAAWPRGRTPISANSVAYQVGADGSSWRAGTNICDRRSLGKVAPMAEFAAMRRRTVRWRRLCPWQNEVVGNVLDPVPENILDVDPRFGLFAMALSQPPQLQPVGPAPVRDRVSVDMQAGSTMEVGALPLNHDRLLNQSPLPPTRIVSASGIVSGPLSPSLLTSPVFPTLDDALAAIATDPLPTEVIRIEDSAVYANETLNWPDGVTDLSICAAPNTRPIVQLVGSIPGTAEYEKLSITGVAFTADVLGLNFTLPPAQITELTFVSIFNADMVLVPELLEAEGAEQLIIRRCCLGGISIAEAGELIIEDSIIDSGPDGTNTAIQAPLIHLRMDRVTVLGEIQTERVDISDSIMVHPVFVRERFKGCIRFSLLSPGGVTPRKHRVIRLDPDTGDPVRAQFVTFNRRDPAYLRLAENGNTRIESAASNGGEVGVFNDAKLKETLKGVLTRLVEHTPAGLRTGLIRQD